MSLLSSSERLPGEGPRAFPAYLIYRDMGPERSCAKVGRALGKSSTLMERWSSKWSWVSRARQWDEELQIAAVRSRLEAIEDMERRHLEAAKSLISKGFARLATLDSEELSMREATQAIIEGAKLERLTLGESTERVDILGWIEARAKEEGWTEADALAAISAAGEMVDAAYRVT